jgi:hypothetical protein
MSRSSRKIDEMRRKVRAMARGGNLDELLNRECEELTRLLREEMVLEREEAVSQEADFPPSGLPSVRPRGDGKCGEEGASSTDAERRD